MTSWKWFSQEDRASWPSEHKRCRSCQEVLPFSKFDKHSGALFGVNTICKSCRKPKTRKNYYAQSIETLLYDRAKSRAKRLGREFDIAVEDILVPDRCPILGIPIISRSGPNSPSLDRIDSSRGYVRGNIQVISTRANSLKNNASLQEIEKVYLWMKSHDTINTKE